MSITQHFTELVQQRKSSQANLLGAAREGSSLEWLSAYAANYRCDYVNAEQYAEHMRSCGIDQKTIDDLEYDA